MSSLFKNLLGNSARDRELTEEMRSVLSTIQNECSRFERLVEGSHAAAERLEELGEPIAKAERDADAVSTRMSEIEQRFAAMLDVATRLETLDERAEAIARNQDESREKIESALEDVNQIRSLFEEMGQKVEAALGLKDQLENFLEVEKPFQILQNEADSVRSQVEGTGEHLARLREQHERLVDAHKLATSKMEALDLRREELSRDLQDKERRVSSFDQALRGMDGVQHTVDDVRREVNTLKTLADLVAQKSAALEAQREAVENALARADQLDRALRQIDAGVRQQQENERSLDALKDQIASLQSLQETVVERSREITQLQRTAEEHAQSTRQDLAGVRDEMKSTIERFDFESRGLESVSQRVADLRGELSDFEVRLRALAGPAQAVAELKSQTEGVIAQLQNIAFEVEQVEAEAIKLNGIRRDLDETSQKVREASERMLKMAEAQPAVEAAVRDLGQLGSSNAMVKDALEQSRLAHDEVERIRESQTETRSWLTEVEKAVAGLRERAEELRTMEGAIDSVERKAQRVIETTSTIDSRREFVDDMQRRLAELGSIGARLDERGQQLQVRMDAAEQRFLSLGSQSEEADRIAHTIAGVTAGVEASERSADDIAKTLATIETRAESIEGLAEKTRTLRQEIEQRQRALDEAAKDLQRSSDLRQEAAATAQQLESLAKRLATDLSSAEERAVLLGTQAAELEDRTAELRNVEARLDEFGERLKKWDRVESEVARDLEQIVARQTTVEALRTDLDRMSNLAEKTSKDVRAITSAHKEIEESRGLLEDVRGRLREVRDTTSELDERKRQLIKAEKRLAKADALLHDIRSSLEVLQGQKVLVDQAVEKAGSLRFLLKQAEGMIEGLREERDMTALMHAAVAAVREEDEAGRTGDNEEDIAQAA
ncbi:MAG: hypothetical protein ACREOU_02850 [Candidatus Eiseniibacteriota bacterium]